MRYATPMYCMILMAILLGPVATILAGGGPENVAVVVNSESPDSIAVANEYVHLRHIPVSNVIYLKDVPSAETSVPIEAFREKILKPLFAAIAARGNDSQIDIIAYSAGFPTTVDFQGDLGTLQIPKAISPGASLTGLTYLYQGVLSKVAPYYLDLGINWYQRRPLPKRPDLAPWTVDETAKFEEIKKLLADYAKDAAQKNADPEWKAAFRKDLSALLDVLLQTHTNSANLLTLRAGVKMMEGKADGAMVLLEQACDCGWWDADQLANDPTWKPLANRPELHALLARMRQPVFTVPPAQAFHSSSDWDVAGKEVASRDQGRRYVLCTMLAATGGRGTTLKAALASLKRSAGADGTCPKGTIYLMRNSDPRSTCREWAFQSTAAALRRLGVGVVIAEGVLPQKKTDVAGLMTGVADFDWKKSGSVILPGAFCDHLTSFGGILTTNGSQTPLTEFLWYGAAGASGTVAEPYALQAKFPSALFHVFYAQGCNLAESFYQSVSAPYQILLVADPLCQPWARRPKVMLIGSAIDQPVKGTITLRPHVPAVSGQTISRMETYVDGRRVATTKPDNPIILDTKTIDDGSHDLRVVAVAADPPQTQGSFQTRLLVANRKVDYAVTPPKQAEFGDNTTFEVKVKCAGALAHVLFLNGAQIALIDGRASKFVLSTRTLGHGPMTLQTVAMLDKTGQQRILGAPFHIRVNAAGP